MKIPNYVHDRLVDENGEITEQWDVLISQLLTELQIATSEEGFVIPTQPTTNITIIETDAQNGTLLYDKDTNQLKVRLNDGLFHVIQTI